MIMSASPPGAQPDRAHHHSGLGSLALQFQLVPPEQSGRSEETDGRGLIGNYYAQKNLRGGLEGEVICSACWLLPEPGSHSQAQFCQLQGSIPVMFLEANSVLLDHTLSNNPSSWPNQDRC
jgi:hypothetical protein